MNFEKSIDVILRFTKAQTHDPEHSIQMFRVNCDTSWLSRSPLDVGIISSPIFLKVDQIETLAVFT